MKTTFIILVCLSITSITAQTGVTLPVVESSEQLENNLEGVWKIETAEIRQITKRGNTILLPYILENYYNLYGFIYPVLKIDSEQASFACDKWEYQRAKKYEKKGDMILFLFTPPIDTIKFTFEVLPENKLALQRQWDVFNSEKQEMVTQITRIIYRKEKAL